jgi:hypothetical protein
MTRRRPSPAARSDTERVRRDSLSANPKNFSCEEMSGARRRGFGKIDASSCAAILDEDARRHGLKWQHEGRGNHSRSQYQHGEGRVGRPASTAHRRSMLSKRRRMLRCVRLHVTRMVVHRRRVARHAGVFIPRRPHVIVIATRCEGRRGKACDLAGHQEGDRPTPTPSLAHQCNGNTVAPGVTAHLGACVRRPDQNIDASSRSADSKYVEVPLRPCD